MILVSGGCWKAEKPKQDDGGRCINTDGQGSEALRSLYQYKWAMGYRQEEGKALRCWVAVSIQTTKWEQRAVHCINTDRQALRSEVEGRVDEGVYKELQLSARNKEGWVGDGKALRRWVAVSIQTTKWEQKSVGRINTDGQALNSEAEAEGEWMKVWEQKAVRRINTDQQALNYESKIYF